MENMIILLILLFAVAVAASQTIRHFKGQGGCCGGGSYKPGKKKLNKVIAQKMFYVEGMHCENCSNRVMEAVNDIKEVSAVVKLKKKMVIVSYEKMVDDSVIREKIEKAGYTVRKEQ